MDAINPILAEKVIGDGFLWLAYPKGSSNRYRCDRATLRFNRDTGWTTLGKPGFEPVRTVAIDEDWSALWFRRVEYIKNMTRRENTALTEKGKPEPPEKLVNDLVTAQGKVTFAPLFK